MHCCGITKASNQSDTIFLQALCRHQQKKQELGRLSKGSDLRLPLVMIPKLLVSDWDLSLKTVLTSDITLNCQNNVISNRLESSDKLSFTSNFCLVRYSESAIFKFCKRQISFYIPDMRTFYIQPLTLTIQILDRRYLTTTY